MSGLETGSTSSRNQPATVVASTDRRRGAPERAERSRSDVLKIVGVAVSPARAANGGLIVWPCHGGGPAAVELATGDAVVMHPRLGHSGGLNREGMIRYGAYFRFLET